MIETVKIVNETGLHARPATEFAKMASSMKCDVYIEKESKRCNAKSVLSILTLAIAKGDNIKIIAEGENEQDTLKELVDYVRKLTI